MATATPPGYQLTPRRYLAILLNMATNTSKNPVNRLVIYRPKKGSFDALRAILVQHGPMLRRTGLLTDEPVRLWVATDLVRHGTTEPYFVESFQWRDG